ncbi:MAG: DNA-directed RNA polymerase I subunit RPA34 [Fibrobacter sp.]|uniref:DNA-directed RNA polymerase I subunit RPA34 n=1 Tax=Fibrobacter sp. TaxID=35828 RepID=UPI002A91E52C|nr:DNA-directed RNA polymerase I subunit RPA34 [Fibrobacter sp.]MDY6264671.1 DNA-directed RNA polymerase I subunit RPA34 [Fibrobacter sp.]
MIWILGVLCALALVALFFPFVFWIDFGADFNGAKARVCLYKKVLGSFSKNFRKEASDRSRDDTRKDVPEKQSATQVDTDKDSVVEASTATPATPVEKKDTPKQTEEKTEGPTETKATVETVAKKDEKESKEAEPQEAESKEKRSLTDKEFWTLLLTPEFDSRAWWSVRRWMSALFRLFRVRFVDCFVEGFRMEYHHMGYAAALNGFLKSYPYIGDWDFRMDWTRDHDPRIEGHVRISVNLCRLLGLSIATLFYGGIVAWSFWRRRTHILKTGELPELGFIRSKIVKMMMEDN